MIVVRDLSLSRHSSSEYTKQYKALEAWAMRQSDTSSNSTPRNDRMNSSDKTFKEPRPGDRMQGVGSKSLLPKGFTPSGCGRDCKWTVDGEWLILTFLRVFNNGAASRSQLVDGILNNSQKLKEGNVASVCKFKKHPFIFCPHYIWQKLPQKPYFH